MDWENFKEKLSILFGLIMMFLLGPFMVWYGFNDEFSIGDIIKETTTHRYRGVIGTEIREYGTFWDIFTNRILPISIGSLVSYGLLLSIKSFFSSDED